jgi:hypothetical protein
VSIHRYERGAIIKDYVMGGAGLAIVAIPLISTDLGSWMLTIFGGLATLFTVYLLRTFIRSRTTIEVDEVGVRAHGPLPKALPWDEVAELELKYFSTRRDKKGGWMQLIMGDGSKAGAKRINLESSIDAFHEVALAAGEAAERNGLSLSETTTDNLRALSVDGIPGSPIRIEEGLRARLGRDDQDGGRDGGMDRGGF